MTLAPSVIAPQHGPRPLPLFLSILWRETEGDPTLRARAFKGLRRYQSAERIAHRRAGTCIDTQQRARLLQYGAVPGTADRHPVLFVPSLINSPAVLDIAPDNSLLRFLSDRGHAIYQIDWSSPGQGDAQQDVGAHATDLLLPLVERMARPPILVGYCLGGTIALAAALQTSVPALATIASPWNFDAHGPEFQQPLQATWSGCKALCETLGRMPLEVLQSGFWALDPRRTIVKYADFGDMAADSPLYRSFLLVEDWVNEGAPLTFAAGRQLIEDFYGANLPGRGLWTVGGDRMDLSHLACPTLAVGSRTDRIVPLAAIPPADHILSLDLGHVGMIVGRSAPERLWYPLSEWLSAHGA